MVRTKRTRSNPPPTILSHGSARRAVSRSMRAWGVLGGFAALWAGAAVPVSAQDPSGLIVRGAEQGVLTLTAPTLEFRRTILVENMDRGGHADVRIEAIALEGPGQTPVEADWTLNAGPIPDTVAFAGLGSQPLVLSAQLPRNGEYVGYLTLVYGETRRTTTIRITRTRRALGVTVTGGANADGNSGFLRDSRPSVRFTVVDTTGAPAALSEPVLEVLTRGEGAAKTDASFDSAVFVEVAPASSSGGGAAARQWTLALHGLQTAGAYTGTVTLAAEGYREAHHEIGFQARRAGWRAALLILVGVLASALLRRYFSKVKPRLEQQRRVAYLGDDWKAIRDELVVGDVTERERGVLDGIRKFIRHLDQDVARGTVGDGFDDKVRDLDQKLSVFPDWVTRRRQVDAVEPAELRGQFHPTLDTVAAFLEQDRAPQTDADAARAALKKLPTDIEEALIKRVERMITDLEKDVDARIAGSRNATLAAELERSVKPHIREANRLVSQGNHEGGAQALDRAHSELAPVLSRELRTALGKSPPVGVDAQEWKALGDQVGARLDAGASATDPAAVMDAYNAAHATYLGAVSAGLKTYVEQRLKVVPNTDALAEADKKRLVTNLTAIEKTVDEALAELAGGRNAEAARRYSDASEALEEERPLLVRNALMGGSGAPDLAAVGTVVRGGASPRQGASTAMAERKSGQLRSAEAIKLRLKIFAYAADAALFLIATVTGLLVLWAGDPTWGDTSDYLTAFLWGLGVQEVGGSALDYGQLRQKLGG